MLSSLRLSAAREGTPAVQKAKRAVDVRVPVPYLSSLRHASRLALPGDERAKACGRNGIGRETGGGSG